MSLEDDKNVAQCIAGDVIQEVMEYVEGDQTYSTAMIKRVIDVLSTCVAVHGTKQSPESDAMLESSGGTEQ